MSGAARIGIGTAQFGLDYGITNAGGRVSQAMASAILADARAAGIDTVDTAHLYGESEATLGRAIGVDPSFRIVTKTPKFGGGPDGDAVRKLRSAFEGSLRLLGCDRVYGLLLHDPADLLGPLGRILWEAMAALKEEGRVERIGVSVYEGEEIDRSLDRFPLDLVQLPYNPLDDRLVSGGQLDRLAGAGVEIHARSLFLQGLLLQAPESIPSRLPSIRAGVAEMIRQFEREGLSQIEGVLALAFQRPEIHRFICGVTSPAELHAIVSAAEKAQEADRRISFSTPSAIDPRQLNPARWAELG